MRYLLILLLCVPALAHASGRVHLEQVYQEAWCKEHNGKTEYVLKNSMRIDCLTDEYAVEVDFADKWFESIGQALFYAKAMNRKPAVLLIIENKTDWKYWGRLKYASEEKGVTLWHIEPKDLPPKE